MHCIYGLVEHHPISPLIEMAVDLNSPQPMALFARKEDQSSNAMTKSSLCFTTLPPELSLQQGRPNRISIQEWFDTFAKKTSVVRDKPQINPGRSRDVEETEGMSTPTEESTDLLIRNLWKHQTDCILDVLITNLDAPSNIHRKRDFMKHFNCFLYHNNSIPYNNLQLIHSLAKNILRIPTSRVSQHRQWDDGACLSLCSTIRWTTQALQTKEVYGGGHGIALGSCITVSLTETL